MAKILINDLMDSFARQTLESAGHQVDEQKRTLEELSDGALAEYDAVLIRSGTEITGPAIESGSQGNLKVIARAGVGVDNIDITAATHFGVIVVNSPAASTQAVAELTIGHLLACARMIPKAFVTIKAGEWQKNNFTGHELRGKHLGLVGYGRIAQEVASLAEAFGMTIHTFDPFVSAEDFDTKVAVHEDVIGLAYHCTHLSIHCGLTEDTRNIINEKVLDALAKGDGPAVLINCARGGLVDEDATLAALEDGRLDACAFDVFDEEPLDPAHPLSKHDNFIGTPHIGAATIESQERVAAQTVKALLAALDGKPELGWVNKPAESM
ncbi:MAG: hypothetical protein CL992_02805 [Euryarchaeota archaeon]|nr:hypothetical protein [Euryarchaeota archaeon]